jgi:hypothetical protein
MYISFNVFGFFKNNERGVAQPSQYRVGVQDLILKCCSNEAMEPL